MDLVQPRVLVHDTASGMHFDKEKRSILDGKIEQQLDLGWEGGKAGRE